ncbi:MAG: MFS transporter [Acidaminococcaceae bacterium]
MDSEKTKFTLWSKNFILFSLANFLFYGAFYLYIPVLPQYVELLGGTPTDIGLVGGAFGLSSIIIRPYLGKMADRHGRKSMMIIGTILFAVLFLLFAQITSVQPLIWLRLAHGVCLAMYLAASAAYIADYAPEERRGEVLGIYQTCRVVSMAIFPAIGIWVLQSTESYAMLFDATFITAVVCFLVMFPLKDIRCAQAATIDVELWPIFKQKVVFLCSMVLLGTSLVYGAFLTFLPIFAPMRGVANYGIFFTVYGLATMGSRVFAGKLSDKMDRRKIIVPFSLLVAASSIALLGLNGYAMLCVVAILFGLGYGALVPALTALVVDVTKPEERGPALGFFTSFIEVGIVVGAMGLGVATEALGYENMFLLAGVIVIAMTILFVMLIKDSNLAIADK